MNPAEFNELLAWYILNLLEDSDQQQLEAALVQSPELETELVQLRDILSQLAYSVTPLDPSPTLKDRLLERINTESSPTNAPVIIRYADLEWLPHPAAGVKVAILHTNLSRRELTALFQGDPGAYYPQHRHAGPEDIYTLEGDLIINDVILGPGDYIRSLPQSYHPHATATGCICLAHSCIDDEFLEPFNTTPAVLDLPDLGLHPYIVRSTDLQWQPYATAGVEIAILFQDASRVTGVLRAAAGTHYPLHEHADIEEIFILSGDLMVDGGEVLGPGDYIRSLPRSQHGPSTQQGCRFFFSTSVYDQLLPDTINPVL